MNKEDLIKELKEKFCRKNAGPNKFEPKWFVKEATTYNDLEQFLLLKVLEAEPQTKKCDSWVCFCETCLSPNCPCSCHSPKDIKCMCICHGDNGKKASSVLAYNMCEHCCPPLPQDTIKGWEVELEKIEEEWKKHKTMNTCSVCDSPKGHTTIKDFIRAKIEEARAEGYEEGLNLRKEYNDPNLLKQIETQLKKELREKIEKIDIFDSCEGCSAGRKRTKDEVLKIIEE